MKEQNNLSTLKLVCSLLSKWLSQWRNCFSSFSNCLEWFTISSSPYQEVRDTSRPVATGNSNFYTWMFHESTDMELEGRWQRLWWLQWSETHTERPAEPDSLSFPPSNTAGAGRIHQVWPPTEWRLKEALAHWTSVLFCFKFLLLNGNYSVSSVCWVLISLPLPTT